MDRRALLGAFGAVGVASLVNLEARAADEPAHHHMDKDHESCLHACGQCAVVCNMAAHHCLDKLSEGQGASARLHARAHSMAMDCQAFCILSATMIARSSELMAASCEACAEACRQCAEACEKAPQDDVMRECVKKCRDCEKSCREMVRHMKAGA